MIFFRNLFFVFYAFISILMSLRILTFFLSVNDLAQWLVFRSKDREKKRIYSEKKKKTIRKPIKDSAQRKQNEGNESK